jgi:hypothetical protein
MGVPTVAMGLLGLVIPPVQAAALLIVPSLVRGLSEGPRCGRPARPEGRFRKLFRAENTVDYYDRGKG